MVSLATSSAWQWGASIWLTSCRKEKGGTRVWWERRRLVAKKEKGNGRGKCHRRRWCHLRARAWWQTVILVQRIRGERSSSGGIWLPSMMKKKGVMMPRPCSFGFLLAPSVFTSIHLFYRLFGFGTSSIYFVHTRCSLTSHPCLMFCLFGSIVYFTHYTRVS